MYATRITYSRRHWYYFRVAMRFNALICHCSAGRGVYHQLIVLIA